MPHRMSAAALIVAIYCAFSSAGCDKPDGRARPGEGGAAQASAASATTAAAPGATTGTGVIRGKIKFAGAAPVSAHKDQPCHNGEKVTIPDEAFLMNAAGELKNAIVFLKNPPATSAVAPKPPRIDQKNCVYLPHVVACQVGQTLEVTSSDDVLHNIHVLGKPEMNVPSNKGDVKTYAVEQPGFFVIKCDVHGWMTVRVGAFDHPFFAVTGDDGAFEFKGLPAGKYTVGVAYEKLGQREVEVTVADGTPADATITISKK